MCPLFFFTYNKEMDIELIITLKRDIKTHNL